MSLTIVSEPASICFSKNLIRYKVSSDDSSIKEVRGRLYVEDVPQSGTYSFVVELSQKQSADGYYYFNFSGIFEEDVLTYDKPNFYQDAQVQAGISKRFYVKFFEYDPDALTLVEELYHEDSDADTLSYVDITALADSTTYIVVLESEDANTPILRDGASESGMTGLYFLGDEQWYFYANGTGNTFDEIKIPGYTKATIYEGSPYTIKTSTTVAVLYGGNDIKNEFIFAPISAPSNVQAQAISSDSVELTWDTYTDIADSFTIRYSKQSDFSSGITEITGISAVLNTYDVTGLEDGVTHYFQIKAINGGTSSDYSDSVNAVTWLDFGNQFVFDGVNDRGEVVVNETSDIDEFTFECWLTIKHTFGSDEVIFNTNKTTGGPPKNNFAIVFSSGSNKPIYVRFRDSSGNSYDFNISIIISGEYDYSPAVGEKVFFCFSLYNDGSNYRGRAVLAFPDQANDPTYPAPDGSGLAMIVDDAGTTEDDFDYLGQTGSHNGTPPSEWEQLQFGAFEANNGSYYENGNVAIAEARIYKDVLSYEEMYAQFNKGKGRQPAPEKNLFAHYNFDAIVNTNEIQDEEGANNITLVNTSLGSSLEAY